MAVTLEESRQCSLGSKHGSVAELGISEHTNQTFYIYCVLGIKTGNVLLRCKQNYVKNT